MNSRHPQQHARELLDWLAARIDNGDVLPRCHAGDFQRRISELWECAHDAGLRGNVADGWRGVREAMRWTADDDAAHVYLLSVPGVGRILLPIGDMTFDGTCVRRLRKSLTLMAGDDPPREQNGNSGGDSIPLEFQTAPMSLAEAGTRKAMQPKAGSKARRREAAGKAMRRAIDAGSYRWIKSGSKFIFDKREVPDGKPDETGRT